MSNGKLGFLEEDDGQEPKPNDSNKDDTASGPVSREMIKRQLDLKIRQRMERC